MPFTHRATRRTAMYRGAIPRGRPAAGRPPVAPGAARMAAVPRVRYQVGLALAHGRVAVLAEADGSALAQAHQLVIARLLRDGPWPAVVVIVRQADGVMMARLP